MKMDLDEAISHAKEVAKGKCDKCGEEHKQLAEWLEELKQYRKLGTVEELQTMMDNGAFTGTELAQIAAMQMKLKEYQQLGTVEELREARTKQTQKVIKGINMMTKESAYYCKCCGQKLDWRDMKGEK